MQRNVPKHLHHIGFVLFSPDATTTGLYLNGIEEIQNQGLIFADFKWIQVNKSLVEKLYAKNRQENTHGYENQLVDTLFGLDYSLACIVRAPTDFRSLPVSSFLKSIKGVSNPTRCELHHIRYILGAENKIMNFLHTSDTPADVLREATLFFPKACNKSTLLQEAKCPPAPKELLKRESVSAFFTLYELKCSILKFHSNFIDEKIAKTFKEEKKLAIKKIKTHATIHSLKAIYERQRKFSFDSIFLPVKPREVFNMLTSIDFSTCNIEFLLSMIRSIGITITAWEELSLRCQRLQGGFR